MTTTLRSALYVDFDNVFTGLRQTDRAAAEAFAKNPGRWLSRLETGSVSDGSSFRRRFLARVCYLNPTAFAEHRSDFARAGFRVVDCPSLTRQGKSGADIQLALDVMDALNHVTRYDEFVICSADADFTPLMARLRAHDRRTVMIAASPVSSAYQSMCDEVLGPTELAEAALGSPGSDGGSGADGGTVSQDSSSDPPTDSIPLSPEEEAAAVTAAVDAVRLLVTASPAPVRGSTAANAARLAAPRLAERRWGGDGFLSFCKAHLVPDITVVHGVSGGYLLDPSRHSIELLEPPDSDDIVDRVCRLTGAPRLTSEQFGVVFQTLAEELQQNSFSLTVTGRNVRDAIAGRGHAVGRAPVAFVLQGLAYRTQGDMDTGTWTPTSLAEAWRDNTLDLARNAGLDISQEDLAVINDWILPPAEAAQQ